MKGYLLYIGSLMLLSVGLPLLYARHMENRYSETLKVIRLRPRFRRTRALAEKQDHPLLRGIRLRNHGPDERAIAQ